MLDPDVFGVKKSVSSPRHSSKLFPRMDRDSEPTRAFTGKEALEINQIIFSSAGQPGTRTSTSGTLKRRLAAAQCASICILAKGDL